MDVYAQRQGGTPSAYRFIFDGNRIVETQTPDDVRTARSRSLLRKALCLRISGDTAARLTVLLLSLAA
jgi:hypothetical protein